MSVALRHRFDGTDGAPVLVLSSSLGATLGMFDEIVPALAERFRVLRYDHRGHGGSPVPDGPYAVSDLADDVVALLDRLEIEHASFCGISMGGAVGMALALRAPERVDRLALCATAAHMPPAADWRARAQAVREGGTAAIADGVLERWFTPQFAQRLPRRARPHAP